MAKAQVDATPVLEAAEEGLDKIEKFLDAVDKAADKGTDVVEAGLETVVDVVPDALDATVHAGTKGGRKLVRFLRDPKHLVILAGVVGAGLGFAGYYLAVKRLKAKMQTEFDIQLESEIAEMRRFYELRHKDGKFSTPASAVEALLPPEVALTIQTYQGKGGEKNVKIEGSAEVHLGEALAEEDQEAVLRESGYTDEQIADVLGKDTVDLAALRKKMQGGEPVEITESTSSNIFLDGHPVEDFDYAAEVAKRDPETPYVITHDEFMENENGWTQATLTYYNGDDVLTDDQDMPIPDIEAIVDSENLTKFGYGSRDKNVVYVRNEKIETDFEITFSQGEFSKEVGGFNELKHSAPIRRFRGDNE